MYRLSKKHFWTWFEKNNQEYVQFRNKSKKEMLYWHNELTAHLRSYFKYIGFSITWPNEGCPTLFITVNGKERYFKRVDTLVRKAPIIPGWQIEPLENPQPIDFACEILIEKSGIDPRELYFSVYDDPCYAMLSVYHPLCTKENSYLIYELAWQAAYNLLGERTFGIEIGDIEVLNLSTIDRKYVKPLEELPYYVGVKLGGLAVDGWGRLRR